MTEFISKIKNEYQCNDKTCYLTAIVIWLFFSNIFYLFYNVSNLRIFDDFSEVPVEKYYLELIVIVIYILIADSLFEPNKVNKFVSLWGGILSCSLCFFWVISDSNIGLSKVINLSTKRIITIITDATSFYKETNQVAYIAMCIMLVVMVVLLLNSAIKYGRYETHVYSIMLAIGVFIAIKIGELSCNIVDSLLLLFYITFMGVFIPFQCIIRRFYYPSCHNDLLEISVNEKIDEWDIHDESLINIIIMGVLIIALVLSLILGKAENLKTIINLLLPDDNYSETIGIVNTQRNYFCFFMAASAYLTAVLVPAVVDFVGDKISFFDSKNSKVFSINKSLITVIIQIYWFGNYAEKISSILMNTDNETRLAINKLDDTISHSSIFNWIMDAIENFMGDNIVKVVIGGFLALIIVLLIVFFFFSVYVFFIYAFAYFILYFVVYLFLCLLSYNCMNLIGIPTTAILSVAFLTLINKFIDSMMSKFVRFGKILESGKLIKSTMKEKTTRDLKRNQRDQKWAFARYISDRSFFTSSGMSYEDLVQCYEDDEKEILEGIEKRRRRKDAIRRTVPPWDRPDYKRAYSILKNSEALDGVAYETEAKKAVPVKKDSDYDFDYEFDESELHFDIEDF